MTEDKWENGRRSGKRKKEIREGAGIDPAKFDACTNTLSTNMERQTWMNRRASARLLREIAHT